MRAVITNAAQSKIIVNVEPAIAGKRWAFSDTRPFELLRRGKSLIKRPAIASESVCPQPPPGNRAINEANLCVAGSVGNSDNSAASSQGSMFSRESAERTLSGISLLSAPMAA